MNFSRVILFVVLKKLVHCDKFNKFSFILGIEEDAAFKKYEETKSGAFISILIVVFENHWHSKVKKGWANWNLLNRYYIRHIASCSSTYYFISKVSLKIYHIRILLIEQGGSRLHEKSQNGGSFILYSWCLFY